MMFIEEQESLNIRRIFIFLRLKTSIDLEIRLLIRKSLYKDNYFSSKHYLFNFTHLLGSLILNYDKHKIESCNYICKKGNTKYVKHTLFLQFLFIGINLYGILFLESIQWRN